MPPDPLRIRSKVKSSLLYRSQSSATAMHLQTVSVVLPASDFLYPNEFGHAHLQAGIFRFVVSLNPLQFFPSRFDWFDEFESFQNALTADRDIHAQALQVEAPWNLKDKREIAPCVHYTNRKQTYITLLMALFMAGITIISCVLGCLIKRIHEYCVDAYARLEARHAQVPFDPVERAERQRIRREGLKLGNVQLSILEKESTSPPKFLFRERDSDDEGVGFSYDVPDSVSNRPWLNVFDGQSNKKMGAYSAVKDERKQTHV